MTNVHDILEKARAGGTRLAPNEAAVLFAAAVRTAAAQGATLRARFLQIDDAGILQVLPFDDQAPETEPGYLAPELQGKDAPRKSEPRVQVYAAGALGYELLTGQRASGQAPGPELSGPLGDIVRIALAADRRERFGDLGQLYDAVEGVQPRPPAEGERSILAGLRSRWSRPPPEKEAVAKLIEKVHHLETQLQQLAKAQSKLEAGARETSEHLDRFLDGQQRLEKKAPSTSVIAPAILAGLLASVAVLAAAWAVGMVAAPAALRAPAPLAVAPAEPPLPVPSPAPVAPAPDASVAAEAAPVAAPPDAGALAAAPPPDAGAIAEDTGAADAGLASAADAGLAPSPLAAAVPPPKPAPAPKRRSEVTQAAMLHAVALSQVRRGEAALVRGSVEEALESFRAALENEPTVAVAYRGMGMAYAMQGNDAQALQAYDKYLKLSPNASDAGDIRRSMAELKARSKIGSGEK